MERASAVEIRAAQAGEIAACRVLLAADHPPVNRGERFLAAFRQPDAAGAQQPQLLGAASYLATPGSLAGIRVRVVRPVRRQGIGSSLMRAVLAQRLGPAGEAFLVAWRKTGDEEVAEFAGRFGFRLSMTIVKVEGALAALAGYYGGLRDRLRARGRIPAGASIVPLREAPREQVLQLIARELQERQDPGARVAHTVQHTRYDDCPVAMHNGEVAGALLWEVTGHVAEIPVRVVAPGQQGSWVNVLLLAHATTQGFDRQIDRIRFEIPQGNSDTAKLAGRYQAQVIENQEHYQMTWNSAP
ncbi:MAG: hypothetical protein IT162_07575 [Bryobacterales bacterium]|nr:hypothetical protein [Bryobacterales bacterium]